MDKEKVKEWLKEADGYCILSAEFFSNMGMEFFERSHSCDPELGKHAATRSDGKEGDVEGVSEFNAIYKVCRELGVDSDTMFNGRGSRFACLKERCLKVLNE